MSLVVQPVTGTIGAAVSGVDLREPLAKDERDGTLSALLDHGVLFFRDQGLSPHQLVAFARQFGEISLPPMSPETADCPEVMVLDQAAPKGQGADNWHSDNTFMAEPPMGSILQAVQLPQVGGDTCFAHACAAFEALSQPLRELAAGLRAVHDITKPMSRAVRAGIFDAAKLASLQQQWPPVEHPVVRTHPVTGRRALFVNGNSTTRLVGLSDRENDWLLPFLNDWVRSPEFQCRFTWQPGSIAFWDNRSVQHFAVPDYTERRVMHRVTLQGDAPR